jgi:o-succinylbenzoate synthase
MVSGHALNRKTASRKVEGFLIHHAGGYGCVQPWPSLGHAGLEDHWQALAQGVSLPLLERAMLCARLDGEARAASRSWWSDVDVPPSHATITDWGGENVCHALAGFTHAKSKVGASDASALTIWARRSPHLRLRLDCNEVPTEEEFFSIFGKLPLDVRERIDWVEDPFVYDEYRWRKGQLEHGIRFALDRALNEQTASDEWVSVWKPAWQERPHAEPLVVTSAMDHPVGQCWAAYCAARAGVSDVCGLRTDHLFAKDAFLERMGVWCSAWPVLGGTGMGFDELLEKLPWIRIR